MFDGFSPRIENFGAGGEPFGHAVQHLLLLVARQLAERRIRITRLERAVLACSAIVIDDDMDALTHDAPATLLRQVLPAGTGVMIGFAIILIVSLADILEIPLQPLVNPRRYRSSSRHSRTN